MRIISPHRRSSSSACPADDDAVHDDTGQNRNGQAIVLFAMNSRSAPTTRGQVWFAGMAAPI